MNRYYIWGRRIPSTRAWARVALDERVKDAFLVEKRRAGAPRLTAVIARSRRGFVVRRAVRRVSSR